MAKQTTPGEPVEIPQPERQPEIKPPADPKEPVIPVEDPGGAPYEDPYQAPPIEIPQPGEHLNKMRMAG